MTEMTNRTLTYSNYDADMKQMTLIFDDGNSRVVATGKAPKESFNNENYFDSEENINAFLEDWDTEIEMMW